MDYRQQTAEATTWRRARQVVIANERDAVPSVVFKEEDVVRLISGEEYRTPSAGFVAGTFNPTEQFPLVNPSTGETTGTTATHADLYVLLHSLYLHLAAQRDASGQP